MDDFTFNQVIRDAVVNNMLNVHRDMVRNIRNPNRQSLLTSNLISSMYYNNPPEGGYQIDEEHDYILPDRDDLASMVFFDVVSRFGSPGNEASLKEAIKQRSKKIKDLGKYKKIKESDLDILIQDCPVCLETFKIGDFQRTLDCTHFYYFYLYLDILYLE
jgi:hypothetical protein